MYWFNKITLCRVIIYSRNKFFKKPLIQYFYWTNFFQIFQSKPRRIKREESSNTSASQRITTYLHNSYSSYSNKCTRRFNKIQPFFNMPQDSKKNMKFYEFLSTIVEFHLDTFPAKIPFQIRNTLVNRNTGIQNYYYSPHVPYPFHLQSAFHFHTWNQAKCH